MAALISAKYLGLCPNCGGPISYSRLSRGLPCEACLPEPREGYVEELKRAGRLKGLGWLKALEEEERAFLEFFRARLGLEPWGAQRSWARRLLMLESFAIIAPTGVGKSTLLMAYAAFRALQGWRALYLVPTENLARQVSERLRGLHEGTVAYYSSLPKRAREEALARIASGNLGVLVVTTGFLERRAHELPLFDLVIVDDVDSLVRDSKNVERVLRALGFREETIAVAAELVRQRLRLRRARAAGAGAERLELVVGELEGRLRRLMGSERGGQLVVASATGRPKGHKHLIFRELLNFEVGGGGDYVRNVIDSYAAAQAEEAVRVAKLLGKGGIVFVSQYLGKAYVERIAQRLREEGLRASKALAGSWRGVLELEGGKADVLVTVASRYGVAVRGLDAPRVVKYVVFAGAPARRVRLEDALSSPLRLLRLLLQAKEEGSEEGARLASEVMRALERAEPEALMAALREGAEGQLAEAVELLRRAKAWALGWAKERLRERGEARVGTMLIALEGEPYAYLPDAITYLQASGRASRLLEGRMTLGLSVVVEPREELVRALEAKLRAFADVRFLRLQELDLEAVKEELEESRRGGGRELKVRTRLLIVESPTKARTIGWFWGRPGKRRVGRLTVYETSYVDDDSITILQVAASRGHLFDLVEELEGSRHGVLVEDGSYVPVYGSIKRCLSCGAQYVSRPRCPRCSSQEALDALSTVEALRRLALSADEVVIATDPDREGEKIALDVALALKPYAKAVRRARIYEISRREVTRAIREAGDVDLRLAEAQMARRIADRWIGYELSALAKQAYGKEWLGAGRVQTPVLGWVVERYRHWSSSQLYKACLKLAVGYRVCFSSPDRREAERAALSAVVVERVTREEATLSPPPPYSTDSMLYEASLRLGMRVEAAMRVAQELFEAGLITYHRTDSIRVSSQGAEVARAYLAGRGLEELFRPRSWSEEGAHEAIRPTRPLDLEALDKAVAEGTLKLGIRLTERHRELYDLIFRRFMASQMAEARALKVSLELSAAGLRASAELTAALLSPGFALLYGPRLEPWALSVKEGDQLEAAEATVRKGSAVSLYTSGELVRLMKERGIGRPSTYHKAIEANRRHGYVVESKRRGAIVPTKMGIEVYSLLRNKFPLFVSEEYTRALEEKLDEIERGKSAGELLGELWSSLAQLGSRPSEVPPSL
ncbi:MAG: reverse gyrase [Acidilobaceae archaeon]|nr:reverse gyrase [Acidilobaceae archaeon]